MKPRKRRASADSDGKVRDSAEASVGPRSRLTAKAGARVRLTKRMCLERSDATMRTRPDFRFAAGASRRILSGFEAE